MQREYINLGSCPVDEPCPQINEDGFDLLALDSCTKWKNFLIQTFGVPPNGAKFEIKEMSHDYGTYLEVVIEFDDSNHRASEYAWNVEANLPEKWG